MRLLFCSRSAPRLVIAGFEFCHFVVEYSGISRREVKLDKA